MEDILQKMHVLVKKVQYGLCPHSFWKIITINKAIHWHVNKVVVIVDNDDDDDDGDGDDGDYDDGDDYDDGGGGDDPPTQGPC